MRLIDADELYEKTVKWEERALQNVTSARSQGDANKLMIWSAVLTERSTFKYDIADAKTIELPERKKARWIDGHCSNCGCDIPAYIIDWKWQKDMDAKFCPNCGYRMVGESN